MATYDEWLSGRGFAATTVHARSKFYRSRLRDWQTWDLPPDHIASWLSGYRGWSRHTYHNHLCSIYAWRGEVEPSAPNPMAVIRQVPAPRPRPRPLTEDELTRALEASDGRTKAFLLLGYLAGLRSHEIAKMHGGDIDESGIYVLGKGGQGWSVPTHPVLWDLAQTYPREDYWFPPKGASEAPHLGSGMVTHYVGQLLRSVGARGACHRTRHSYGTSLLRGGANLRVVQDLMRHASLSTTALYLGVDEAEKVAAIGGLHVAA